MIERNPKFIMKKSVVMQEPKIVLIDLNRLFRERIDFLLRNEIEINSPSVVVAESLTSLPATMFEIDLLLIDAHYLNSAKERQLFENLTAQSPDMVIILWVEGVTKRFSIGNPQKNSTDAAHEQILSEKIRHQLAPIERYYTLSRSVDRQAFIDLVTQILTPQEESDKHSLLATLTPREEEILAYLVKGDSNKEIARALHISESTVKVHVQNILKKFSVSSRVEAAVYAVRHELMK